MEPRFENEQVEGGSDLRRAIPCGAILPSPTSKTMAEASEEHTTTKKRARNFCFTDFELLEWGQYQLTYKDVVRYVGIGRETCPKTRRVHYQGWMQFVSPKTWALAKTWVQVLSKKTHLEICRGSPEKNEIYCRKGGAFSSFGSFKTHGQRTELESVKKCLDEEGDMWLVAQDHFREFCKFPKALQMYSAMRNARIDPPWRNVEVILISGPTGTGKTRMGVRLARAHGGGWYMMHGGDMQWFDGYTRQKALLIDEYANQVKITKLLGYLDGHRQRLPVKGTFTHAHWDLVIITTNLDRLHAQANPAHQDALERRITRRIVLDHRPALLRQDVVMGQET